MTIERKTVVHTVEVNRDGTVGVKIAKLLVEDGVEIACEWHRVLIYPEHDHGDVMALVNEHLGQMGLPPVGPECLAKIETHCNACATRATKRSAFLAEEAARLEAQQQEPAKLDA